jgi:hypothetical protein
MSDKCPDCGKIFENNCFAYGLPTNNLGFKKHRKTCLKATPEARSFYVSKGYWPPSKKVDKKGVSK